jgi:uncharacterized iron-regulated membrane protein
MALSVCFPTPSAPRRSVRAFGMMTRPNRLIVWAFAALCFVAVTGVVVWWQASAAADHSAHAALTKEICEQLAAVPKGQPYPDSLAQLRLTFPDGGGTSLLKRFSYRSTGTNCALETRLGREQVLRSFP